MVCNDRAPSSLWAYMSWGMSMAGFLFYIIGFCSPNWSYQMVQSSYEYEVNLGLWSTCERWQNLTYHKQACVSTGSYVDDVWRSGWVGGLQAMMTLGFIFIILSCLAQNGYLFFSQLSQSLPLVFSTMCANFAGAAFAFTGIVIYGVQGRTEGKLKQMQYSWAYILAVLGVALTLFSTIAIFLEVVDLMALQLRNKNSRRTEQRGYLTRQSRTISPTAGSPAQDIYAN